MKRIAITGGAGQIAYSLIFRIANGDFLGPNQHIALHLLDLPESLTALKGVEMELCDSAFPLLKEIKIGSDPHEMFEGVDYAFLVGSKPRGPGMERKELLGVNGKIFVEQGKALNQNASKDVKVLVVGNPCNTNCLILERYAPDINRGNFHAMTRLDQNRALFQLSHKAGVAITDVAHVAIWGNHSSTQVPDFLNAKIRSKPAVDVIKDRKWLEEEFVSKIQKRGAEVIAARGKSSAASATQAILDSMRSILHPTAPGDVISLAVNGAKNPYGIDENLIFSFPCRSKGDGKYEIVKGFIWDDFLEKKIKATEKELIEERDFVSHLL